MATSSSPFDSPSSGYAGDLPCLEAWAILKAEPSAQLIDVRTAAEWNFVGLPDLGELGRQVLTVEWQSFPSGAPNAGFVDEAGALLARIGVGREAPLLFLCRSGARSRAAAMAMTAAGYEKAYNVAAGFEGDPDAQGHRGTRNGWKVSGLPWRQS